MFGAMTDQADHHSRARFPWWFVGVAVLVVALVAVWAVRRRASAPAGGGQAAAAGASGPGARAGGAAGGPGAGQRAIPVTVAAAARKDVPIYLEGLGSVLANRTVTVRSQVDGRLDTVSFREGQDVKQGQVLAQIDPRPFEAQLHQAEGALERDQAQLKNARVNVERDKQLVAQKLVAQQQLDADTATAGQLEGAILMDQAAIETAKLNLSYARITSPIDGVAGIRQVDPGNIVHATDASGIVVLTQLDPIAVIFTLPQDQLGPVAAQQARGPLPVEAYSRDGATLLSSGVLTVIDNQINQTTSTIRLKAIFPNPKRVLWPNQFVNARLRLETRKDVLVVPATAIQRGPNGTFVYVVASDDTAALRPVTVDLTQGDLTILAKGVSEGERVVVDGQNQLRPGAKVAPRPPARAGGPSVASDGTAEAGGPAR
jgi:multidrug efflux system membrane fusion protein